MREKEDNIIGYIEYLSDDGKIIGYVTPFTDVDKFRKEILEAAEVGMPITPVVFPDKLDKSLGLPRDIYWPGGFRKEKRHTYPYEIYQTNNRNFVFRNYAYAKTRMKAADYKLVYSGQMERWDEPEDIYIAHCSCCSRPRPSVPHQCRSVGTGAAQGLDGGRNNGSVGCHMDRAGNHQAVCR